MADDPLHPTPPVTPRPVIPIDEPELADAAARAGAPPAVRGDTAPPMMIPEPGVVAAAPFATVYSPPPADAPAYYPPAYPPPAHPSAAAWPAAPPVGYHAGGAAGYRRPGIVTALAVTGIAVAALSFIASLFTGCAGLMAGLTQPGGFGATRTVTVTLPATTTAVAPVSAGGMPEGQRAIVIDAIRSKVRGRPLSAAREAQLDAFLAEHGRVVFALPDGAPATSADVANGLGKSGVVAGGGP
jgi:hypothetical protein